MSFVPNALQNQETKCSLEKYHTLEKKSFVLFNTSFIFYYITLELTYQAAHVIWHYYSDASTRGSWSFLNSHRNSSKKKDIW